jgi:hypothetical protein
VHFVRTDAEVKPYVKRFDAEVLVFDLTYLAPEVFAAVRAGPRLRASLSPVFAHARHLDLLFTRSARVPPLSGVKILGGLEYAIFSEKCLVIGDVAYQQNLAQAALPIAISMGGGDAANKTLAVLQALASLECDFTIWALLGEGYAHSYNALVETTRGNARHEVILAKTNRSMWHILGNCAMAILAGGLTTIEAVYAGLPTINLFERQEQVDVMATELFDLGVCVNGGLFSENSLETMVETLGTLNAERPRLQDMHQRCHGLVDMRGSERVLRELERHLAALPLFDLADVEQPWQAESYELYHP